MRPLRILVVTQYFWPEAFRVNDLVLGLRDRGHLVEVLAGLPNYPEGRFFPGYGPAGPYNEDFQGVPVRRAPLTPRGRGRGWQLALNYLSFATAATLRLTLPPRRRWDVALVYQVSPVTTALPALALRSLTGLPVAIWVQDLWPEVLSSTNASLPAWATSLIGKLSRWIYSRCDLVLGQSRAFVERLAETGIPRERLAYLPNWAEELYRPVPRPDPREDWERGFTVMFAGNMGRVQALDTALEAAALLQDQSDVHWVFVGDGAVRSWMEGEIARRGLARVHLLGRRPTSEMPELFARAGAMLVSLRADPVMAMTIPAKLQSYLASGRPILASMDGEGARAVTESGAGLASPADDAAALAANVLRMRDLSPSERDAMGQRGRAYCARWFDRRSCLDELDDRLSLMLPRPRPDPGAPPCPPSA